MGFRYKILLSVLFGLAVVLAIGWAVYRQSSGGFVTYRNAVYAYQIDYPRDWQAEGVTQGSSRSVEMTFYEMGKGASGKDQMTAMTVHVYENPRLLSPKDWYAQDAKLQSGGLYPYPASIVSSTREAEVSGMPAYHLVTTDANYDYFIGKGHRIYRLSFEKFGGNATSDLPGEIYAKMLASFAVMGQ